MRAMDRIKAQNVKANAALDMAIAFIEEKAAQEPVSCALADAGLGCACTGLCHTKWYHEAHRTIGELEAAKLPETYDRSL